MAIEWEEAETQPGVAEVGFEGIGGSGTTYGVSYGPAYLNPDAPPVMRWIAYGWPEPGSDSRTANSPAQGHLCGVRSPYGTVIRHGYGVDEGGGNVDVHSAPAAHGASVCLDLITRITGLLNPLHKVF